jgi:hypothetical protein
MGEEDLERWAAANCAYDEGDAAAYRIRSLLPRYRSDRRWAGAPVYCTIVLALTPQARALCL